MKPWKLRSQCEPRKMEAGTLTGYFTERDEARRALRGLQRRGFRRVAWVHKTADGEVRIPRGIASSDTDPGASSGSQSGSESKWPDQVIPREKKRRAVMRAKLPKLKDEDRVRRYQDLLEIARLTKDPVLTQDAEMLYQEIQSLESHLEQFEKNMET